MGPRWMSVWMAKKWVVMWSDGISSFSGLLLLVCWLLFENTTSRMIPRTRSSIRNRDSFQAYSERKIVLWGNAAMLSVRKERMVEGEMGRLCVVWV